MGQRGIYHVMMRILVHAVFVDWVEGGFESMNVVCHGLVFGELWFGWHEVILECWVIMRGLEYVFVGELFVGIVGGNIFWGILVHWICAELGAENWLLMNFRCYLCFRSLNWDLKILFLVSPILKGNGSFGLANRSPKKLILKWVPTRIPYLYTILFLKVILIYSVSVLILLIPSHSLAGVVSELKVWMLMILKVFSWGKIFIVCLRVYLMG